MPLDDTAATPRRHELGLAGRARRPAAAATAPARLRPMHRAPYEHIVTGTGDERVGRFDYRACDHAGLDLRVPTNIRRQRQMIDQVHHADHVDTVAITGTGKR